MKIMSWNIENGGTQDFWKPNIGNIQDILKSIRHEDPVVLVLQEFQTEYEEPLLGGLKAMGYTHATFWQGAPERTLRNRVLIASKLPFECCERPSALSAYAKRNWTEIVVPSLGHLRIIGVDAPLAEVTINGRKRDNKREKVAFLQVLASKLAEYKDSPTDVLCLGDLNLYPGSVCSEFLTTFRKSFQEISANHPTWRDRQLDYALSNLTLLPRIKNPGAAPVWTPFSDHAYFCIDIDIETPA